jgi:hypothetical protein
MKHFCVMKSLLEIEEAIARLPLEVRRQLVQDMPALYPDAFPADGWEAILRDNNPRPALTALLDQLDSEHSQNPNSFPASA